MLTSAGRSGPKCSRYCSAVCQPMPAFKRPTRHDIARTNKVFKPSIAFWRTTVPKQAPLSCMSYVPSDSYTQLAPSSSPHLSGVACLEVIEICFAIRSPWQALLKFTCRILTTDSSMESPLVRDNIFYGRLLSHAVPLEGKLLCGDVGLSKSSRSVPPDIVIVYHWDSVLSHGNK